MAEENSDIQAQTEGTAAAQQPNRGAEVKSASGTQWHCPY